MKKKVFSSILAIIIPLAVGGLSTFLTKDNQNIYEVIIKPKLAPSGVLFPIVWSVLYLLMGISSAVICNADAPVKEKRSALIVYGVQLFVNFFWSILFFNERLFLASFVWLVLLWLLIIAMMLRFYKINKGAAWLQLPYLVWVTFAGYLNLAIYFLN